MAQPITFAAARAVVALFNLGSLRGVGFAMTLFVALLSAPLASWAAPQPGPRPAPAARSALGQTIGDDAPEDEDDDGEGPALQPFDPAPAPSAGNWLTEPPPALASAGGARAPSMREVCEAKERKPGDLKGPYTYEERTVRAAAPVVNGHDFGRGSQLIGTRGASLKASGAFTMPVGGQRVVNRVRKMLEEHPGLYVRRIIAHGDGTCVTQKRLRRWQRAAADEYVLPLAKIHREGRCGATVRRFIEERRGTRLHAELIRQGIPPQKIGGVEYVQNAQKGDQYRGFDLEVAFEPSFSVERLCIPPKPKDGADGADGDGDHRGFAPGVRLAVPLGGHQALADTWGVLVGPVFRFCPKKVPVCFNVAGLIGGGEHNEDAWEDDRSTSHTLDDGPDALFEGGIIVHLMDTGFEVEAALDIYVLGIDDEAFHESLLIGGGGGIAYMPKDWLRIAFGYRYFTGNQGPSDKDVWGTDAHVGMLSIDLYVPENLFGGDDEGNTEPKDLGH